MEKIFHITVPQKLSEIQQQVIAHARGLHPAWEMKIWQDPLSESGFFLEKFWPKVDLGAQLGDLIRLDVVFRYGGVYIDSDLRLLRALDRLAETYDFFIASEDGVHLTNAMFGATRGSPVVKAIIDDLLNNEPDWSLPPNVTTGPLLFTRVLKWKRHVIVLPRESFYAYDSNAIDDKTTHRHSYGEHLWEWSWKPRNAGDLPLGKRLDGLAKSVERTYRSGRLIVKRNLKRTAVRFFRMIARVRSWDPDQTGRVTQRCYQASGEIVAQTAYGFNMLLDGQDISITPGIAFTGTYEAAEERFVERILRGGDWMIDVGANVGLFSLLAGRRVGTFGRVFSYEPNPRAFGLLAKSSVMNWMHDRIIQRPVAIGDSCGRVDLLFVPARLGDGQVTYMGASGSIFSQSARTLAANPESVNVPCVRLDDEFSVDLPIKLLKIDVEGYEAKVMRGAARLINERCIDYIMIELLEEVAGCNWLDTLEAVNGAIKAGYTINTINDDGGLLRHETLAVALGTNSRNFVLAASEQYFVA